MSDATNRTDSPEFDLSGRQPVALAPLLTMDEDTLTRCEFLAADSSVYMNTRTALDQAVTEIEALRAALAAENAECERLLAAWEAINAEWMIVREENTMLTEALLVERQRVTALETALTAKEAECRFFEKAAHQLEDAASARPRSLERPT